jgi:hypothetical protein
MDGIPALQGDVRRHAGGKISIVKSHLSRHPALGPQVDQTGTRASNSAGNRAATLLARHCSAWPPYKIILEEDTLKA